MNRKRRRRVPEARWARRPFFAEAAEALGIATDQVVGMMEHGDGRKIVLHTRDGDDDTILRTWLERDEEQILRAVSETVMVGTVEDVVERIRKERER